MNAATGTSGDGYAKYSVRRDAVDGVVVVSVTGALDIVTSKDFGTRLQAVLGEGPAALVVDLGDLEFLGSAGIAALLDAHRVAGATPLAVVADGPVTGRPLELTGVTDVLAVHPTVTDAIAALNA